MTNNNHIRMASTICHILDLDRNLPDFKILGLICKQELTK